jgi:hypothetical protein
MGEQQVSREMTGSRLIGREATSDGNGSARSAATHKPAYSVMSHS